jgi:hypothetical protein
MHRELLSGTGDGTLDVGGRPTGSQRMRKGVYQRQNHCTRPFVRRQADSDNEKKEKNGKRQKMAEVVFRGGNLEM